LNLHAAIKIVSFLVFGAAMTLGRAHLLLAGAVLLAALYFTGQARLAPALVMLRRLRWLLLSILMVYLFFTPGQLLWPGVAWGPTVPGLGEGLRRVAALALLAGAVSWVLGGTAQDELLSALLWCLRPLTWVGVAPERLAVRITLTLEAVGTAQRLYREVAATAAPRPRGRVAGLAQAASAWLQEVMRAAEAQPLRAITLPARSHPPPWQWLIPLGLAGLLLLVHVYHGGLVRLVSV
jgi:energy-coupling factor transport system permease protein